MQLKGSTEGNHKTLLDECAGYFDEAYLAVAANDEELNYQCMEKAHNQIDHMDFTLARVTGNTGSFFCRMAEAEKYHSL